ncbi:hypothetical protein VE02_05891 [Pseudogymnoascus sp. 03VT05]|nr:hypothetical protein VE02_05891 [Pseudogymnoascus sp. 03VT05]
MLSIDAAVLGANTYKEVKEARKEQQEWHQAEEKISMAIRGGIDESNSRQENQIRKHQEQAILDWLTPIDYAPQQSDFISRRQTGTGQWLLNSTEFQSWLTTKTDVVMSRNFRFLLAHLQLDSLIGKRSPKAVRTALKSLPSGSNAYDDAYKDAMIRMEGQLLDQKDLAWQVLSWITCAKRPLTMVELQHALAIELGESSLDEDNLPQIDDMVTVCAGLVTVDEESEIIRLVHYTTQEYFERTKETWFPNLEAEITKICVTYLSHLIRLKVESARTTRSLKNGNSQTNFTTTPHLIGVTTRAKLIHLSQKSTACFLETNAQLQASIQALLVKKSHYLFESQYSRVYPTGLEGIHVAAHFGIEKTVQHLLGTYISDEKDGSGRTPLSHAAENGHGAVAKLLLANNADINLKDGRYGQTPLSWAAYNGQEPMVKLLVANNADIELKCTRYDWTPLLWAVVNRREAVVKFLLESGAEFNLQSASDRTPLSWAAGEGHEAIFKPLLEKGADIDIKDNNNRAPLSYAAEYGHAAILKLLLVDSAEVNLKCTRMGRTPLVWAADNGHEPIVKLLLLQNAEVDIEDTHDRTALSHAAERGHEVIVKLLLEYNAKVNVEDGSERTPLLYAVRNNHEAVVKLLLEKHAKIDLKYTTHEQTALSLAEMKEDEAVIKLLQIHKKEECLVC